MQITDDFSDVLKIIAKGAIDGTLNSEVDYHTAPYSDWLRSNSCYGADRVLAFLNREVKRLTRGEKSVVYSRLYSSSLTGMGLVLALVPRGEGASSPDAVYFNVGSAIGGVYIAQRSSDKSIEEMRLRPATNARHQEQRRVGKASHKTRVAAEIQRVSALVRQAAPSLTDEEIRDINYFADRHPRHRDLSSFPEGSGPLDLVSLYAIEAITEEPELPSY